MKGTNLGQLQHTVLTLIGGNLVSMKNVPSVPIHLSFITAVSKFKAFRIIYYKLLDFKNSTHNYTIKTSQYALQKHC
jgi:hypothetical protein